jgi:hypothetical protein
MINVFEANKRLRIRPIKFQNRLQNRHASMLKPVLEVIAESNDGKDK